MKILISTGYGAGWSTWNDENKDVARYILTYQPIIEALERGEGVGGNSTLVIQMCKECLEKFGYNSIYCGGVRNLCVKDVEPPFKINEYDGFESVQYFGGEEWYM